MRLRCSQELRELLPWYANNTLPEEERAKVEAHLARCERCQQELRELRQIKEMIALSVESVPEPSEELFARTVERIRSRGATYDSPAELADLRARVFARRAL
jgi:anti-sigma factor RsiW